MAEIRAAVGDDVTIIEDAAHALGARTADEPVGACRHSRHGGLLASTRSRRSPPARAGWSRRATQSCATGCAAFRTHGIASDPAAARARRGRLVPGAARARLQLPAHRHPQRARRARSSRGWSEFIERRNAVADALPRRRSADVDALELPPGRARRAPRTPTTCSSIRHRDGAEARRRALRRAARARHPRPGPLRARLPAPLVPRDATATAAGLCPEAEATTRAACRCRASPTLTEAEQDTRRRRGQGGARDDACPQSSRSAASRSAPGHPTYVIAEAGANHNRDLDIARELIDVAAEPGADAVKFQTYSGERIYSRKTPQLQVPRARSPTSRRPSCWRRSRCRASGRRQLADYAARARHRLLLHARSTTRRSPSSTRSTCPVLKIASFEIVDLPLIRRGRRDRPAADHLDRHGDARRDRGGARGGARRRRHRGRADAVHVGLPGARRAGQPARDGDDASAPSACRSACPTTRPASPCRSPPPRSAPRSSRSTSRSTARWRARTTRSRSSRTSCARWSRASARRRPRSATGARTGPSPRGARGDVHARAAAA